MDWQLFGVKKDGNTKAQKDKSANKAIDQKAYRFNSRVLPFVFLVVVIGVLASLSVVEKYNMLTTICVLSFGILLFGYHFYWIIFFEKNHKRGAQRWRFNFVFSDLLVSIFVGFFIAFFAVKAVSSTVAVALLILCLVAYSVSMIDAFAPYSRVLRLKLLALWLPVISVAIFYAVKNYSLDGQLISENIASSAIYALIFLSIIFHAKSASNNFWNGREDEYLMRLKTESYNAAINLSSEKDSAQMIDLVSAFSQELKIHLDGILSGVHLLKDTPVSIQQRDFINISEKAGEKTVNLIDAVVEYSRPYNFSSISNLTIFPVRRDLEERLVFDAREAHKNNIDLNFIFDKHLPIRIKADKENIFKVITLIVSCVTRLNASGKLLVDVSYQTINGNDGQLSVKVVDLIDEGRCKEKKHPIIEKLLHSRSVNAGASLNYLMANDLAQRLKATIEIHSFSDGFDGVGIKVIFPVEAKSGSTPEFYPNTNLEGKHISIVNCPDRIKLYVADELTSWNALITFFDAEDFLRSSVDLCKDNQELVPTIAEVTHTPNTSINENLKELNTDAVLWFSDITDDGVFSLEKSVVKKAIYLNEHLSTRPVFVVATDHQIQSSLQRQFLHEQPNIHVVQRPLQLHQFHSLLVDSLFNIDFHAHHVLNRIFSLEEPTENDRILLVEDHRVNQLVAEGMLKRLGYQVKIANNGIEALKMLEDREFDLILMDCQMAEMDGYEATEAIRLKESASEKHIPIIALTANTTEEDQNKCLAVGMDDYLSKPVRFSDLEHSLKRWLDNDGRKSIHH